MNISLRLLRAFVAVAREGHVGRAAASLFVSQPSLSQDVRRLEKEVGAELFVRSARGMSLTPAGDELLLAVDTALTLLDRGVERARELSSGRAASISIAYSPSLGNRLLPMLLADVERELPRVAVDVRGVDTGEVGSGVLSGRFDLGLAHAEQPLEGLHLDVLLEEPLCVAVGVNHPLSGRDTVQLQELRGSQLLIWPRQSAPTYYDRIVEVCASAGLGDVGVREHRRSMTRSYLFTDADVFSVLPLSASYLHMASTTFAQLADPGSTVPLLAVTRSDDGRPTLRRIVELARTAAIGMVASP